MTDLIPYNPKYVPKCRGMQNLGNTCYLNALLQCLLSCSSFNQQIVASNNSNNSNNNASNSFYRLMISADSRAIAQINSSIVNNSPLRGGAQEDVQEAFLFLINKVLGPAIMRLFQFRMKKTVSCTECRATIRSECIEDICFNIAPADIGAASLEEFLSQSIDVADGHFCTKCRRKTRKKICNSLLMVPEILCIYVPQLGARKQSINISKTIKFNSTANFLLKFKLIAAAQHHGNNDGGHYTAEVMRNGGIFHCDDSQISQIADFTRSANCSLLFYHYYE